MNKERVKEAVRILEDEVCWGNDCRSCLLYANGDCLMSQLRAALHLDSVVVFASLKI